MKQECIRPQTPVSLDDARRLVAQFIEYYNNTRLHSAIGYVAPLDKLNGKAQEIFRAREHKLEAARARRRQLRKDGLGWTQTGAVAKCDNPRLPI